MSSATIESTIVPALRLRAIAERSDARVPMTMMSSSDDVPARSSVCGACGEVAGTVWASAGAAVAQPSVEGVGIDL